MKVFGKILEKKDSNPIIHGENYLNIEHIKKKIKRIFRLSKKYEI